MVCPPSRNETHQIWRSIIIVLLSYFRSFAVWLNMDLKKWSPWTQLIQKCTRRLPYVTQASRWSHGFQPPGARSGTPLTLPRRSPRTISTKSAKKGPVGTSAYTELNGWHQLSRTSLWSPRPNRKQQPLPYGLKAGQPSPHMTVNRYLSHLNMCLNLQLTPRWLLRLYWS